MAIEHHDKTDEQVTGDVAHAIAGYGVGVTCATITLDEARVCAFNRKRMSCRPSDTIRNILEGAIFSEPIIGRTYRDRCHIGPSRS